MSSHPLHDIAIAGVFNTPQARRLPGETSASVTDAAVYGALADAGLSPRDVDGFSIAPAHPHDLTHDESAAFAYRHGVVSTWTGSNAVNAIPALVEAAAAISFGLAHTIVVANGDAGLYVDRAATAPWTRPANEFVECWGLHTAAEYALVARRHMHLFGTTSEQIAHTASVIRNNGHRNPEAVYYGQGPFTAADVLASRMVASPLHLLDCAMTSEGGAAVVLTTAERARDMPRPPVFLLGAGIEACGPGYRYPPTYEFVRDVGRRAAARAFEMAALKPEDIDALELYDPCSFEVIRQLEAFGFCKEGEGGDFVTSGAIEPDGPFPICTDGGTLSHSHTGSSQILQKIVQAVRQVRGEAAANQVQGCRVSMTSTGGSGSMFNPVLIVGDDQYAAS